MGGPEVIEAVGFGASGLGTKGGKGTYASLICIGSFSPFFRAALALNSL